MSSTEIYTENIRVQIGRGSLSPSMDFSTYNIENVNLGNASSSSTNDASVPQRVVEASGTSIAPAGPAVAPQALQLQQLHAEKHTHAYHQRSDSSSSTEGELPNVAVGASGKRAVKVPRLVVGGEDAAELAANSMVDLNEADAAMLISPILSRTQSATLYDKQRCGSATRLPQSAMPELEDYEDDTPDGPRFSPPLPRVVVNHAATLPTDIARKEQKMGVLSSTAHRLSTISGFHLPKSGSGRQSPPEGTNGTSTPKTVGRKGSMFTFTLPSFHLPQIPSPPSFLTDITTRKRSKSNVLGNPSSKTTSQSSRSSLFFGKPIFTDRDVSPPGDALERPQFTPLRRSSSHPSLLSYSSSFDEARFANVQSMTNARIKAIKDNFRGMSPGNTIANAANALSTYANSLNSALSYSSSASNLEPATSSSNSQPNAKPHPLDTVEGDIVVMGGYRGSILREASGQKRRVWIPLRVGLNLRKVNLEIGLDDNDEEAMSEKIVADGMLTHIGPVDIGRRLLRRLRTGQGNPSPDGKKLGRWVYEYGYDWRLSPHILSRQLIAYLEQLPCNQGNGPGEPRKPGKGALVIAHSLGGLIVRHAMNQRPELFSGVLFAGTPQHCVNILGPLRNGDTVMLSSRVLTAQVNFTLRSSYALLPEDGQCFVDKNTGEKIAMDLFDVNTWIRHALSPCVTTVKNVPRAPTFPSTNGSYGSNGYGHAIGETIKDAAKEGANAAFRDRTLAPQMDSTSSTLNPFSQIPSLSENRVCTLPVTETVPYLDRTLRRIRRFKEELQFKPEIGYPLEETAKASRDGMESPVELPEVGSGSGNGSGDEITSIESPSISPNTSTITVVPEELNRRVYYPPMAIIYANNTPTVKGARVDGVEGIQLDNVYDDLIFGAGEFETPIWLRCCAVG